MSKGVVECLELDIEAWKKKNVWAKWSRIYGLEYVS